jgi:predicted kinase
MITVAAYVTFGLSCAHMSDVRRIIMPTLHLICGLPGSGKSTLAEKLEKELPALRLTPDIWIKKFNEDGHNAGKRKLIESIQCDIAIQVLKLGINVVLENGFWSKQERQQYRERARAHGAQTKLHYLDVTPDELKRRIASRNANLPPDAFHIDPEKIDRFVREFEAPTIDELEGF